MVRTFSNLILIVYIIYIFCTITVILCQESLWGWTRQCTWRHEWREFVASHKIMIHNLIKRKSWTGLRSKQLSDQILPCRINLDMIREGILVHFDPLVSWLHIWGFKRRSSDKQSIQNYTNTPHINLIRVTGSWTQNLRSDIVWSPADSPFLFSIKHHFCRQSKIANFHLHLVIQKQVS